MTNEKDTVVSCLGSAISTSKLTFSNLQETLNPLTSYINSVFEANNDKTESDTVTID